MKYMLELEGCGGTKPAAPQPRHGFITYPGIFLVFKQYKNSKNGMVRVYFRIARLLTQLPGSMI